VESGSLRQCPGGQIHLLTPFLYAHCNPDVPANARWDDAVPLLEQLLSQHLVVGLHCMADTTDIVERVRKQFEAAEGLIWRVPEVLAAAESELTHSFQLGDPFIPIKFYEFSGKHFQRFFRNTYTDADGNLIWRVTTPVATVELGYGLSGRGGSAAAEMRDTAQFIKDGLLERFPQEQRDLFGAFRIFDYKHYEPALRLDDEQLDLFGQEQLTVLGKHFGGGQAALFD
jgi:hypothetical protein